MLFKKGQFIPISPLKYDLAFYHMEKSASAKTEGVTPFQNCPLSIFKNILNNGCHFVFKFTDKHFIDCLFSYDRFITNLMIDGIFCI